MRYGRSSRVQCLNGMELIHDMRAWKKYVKARFQLALARIW
jgi:hypothetical protein